MKVRVTITDYTTMTLKELERGTFEARSDFIRYD